MRSPDIVVCVVLGLVIGGVILVALSEPDQTLRIEGPGVVEVHGWKIEVRCVETERVMTDKIRVEVKVWEDWWEGKQ